MPPISEDHDLLIRLDEKMTQILDKIESLVDSKKDHEERIRALEIRMWWANGASAILGGVLGIVFGQIYHNVFK